MIAQSLALRCAVFGLLGSRASFGVFAAAAAPRNVKTPQILLPGVRHQRTLAAGLTHAYGVQIDAGDFIRVLVAPHGIDVAATLIGPDRRDLLTADLTPDPDLPETILIVAVDGTLPDHRHDRDG